MVLRVLANYKRTCLLAANDIPLVESSHELDQLPFPKTDDYHGRKDAQIVGFLRGLKRFEHESKVISQHRQAVRSGRRQSRLRTTGTEQGR